VLTAIWMLVNSADAVSSYDIRRTVGVTQKTAWLMNARIRPALSMPPEGKLGGEVGLQRTFHQWQGSRTASRSMPGSKDARQHCNSRAANMKPKPAPTIPGNTEGERMSNALRMVLAVPKDVILAAEAKLKEEERRRKE
jgi:hypothetical protein